MPVNIVPIRALKDNYIWALVDPEKKLCVIVDPGDAKPVIAFLKKHKLKLLAILITHHHWDHTQGLPALLEYDDKIIIFGPKNDPVDIAHYRVGAGNTVEIKALGIQLAVLDTPGHTLGHIAYYGQGALFCGDTLFTGGCGRIFEGTFEEMYASLSQLAKLPDETLIYCGHEYTKTNLKFALVLEPHNQDLIKRIKEVNKKRARKRPTVPECLAIEKKTNPFLRCQVRQFIEAVEKISGRKAEKPEAIFNSIRQWKDNF